MPLHLEVDSSLSLIYTQNMKSAVRLGVVGLISTLFGVLHADLSPEAFRYLMKELQAPEKTGWRSIPWKTSLLEAQRIGARQRKPLFIWAMDGHPLGCT